MIFMVGKTTFAEIDAELVFVKKKLGSGIKGIVYNVTRDYMGCLEYAIQLTKAKRSDINEIGLLKTKIVMLEMKSKQDNKARINAQHTTAIYRSQIEKHNTELKQLRVFKEQNTQPTETEPEPEPKVVYMGPHY